MTTEASGRTRLRLARGTHYWAELVIVVVMGLVLLATLFSKLFLDPFFYFLPLSFRTTPQYWVWFLVLAPFCLSGREGSFWLVSGSLASIVMLLEWGLILSWRPLFLIAVISADLWYRQSYRGNARHG